MILSSTDRSTTDELGEHREASDGQQKVVVNASPETVAAHDWSEIWPVADRLYGEGRYRAFGDARLVRVEAEDF